MVTDESGKEEPEAAKTGVPSLSEDFFRELLDPPSCKARGYCDNCGRCEH